MERAVKRALDFVCAAIAIVFLSPLFLLIAIAIKLDSKGPVIFKQRRNGFNSKQFVIYKFRSMTVLEDGAVIAQARKNDRRVTRVGQILRRSSMDELPQLFNVLKGDMSLVGPRPHALAHDNEYKVLIAKYAFRHHVKPGMTGWAQVNGLRGETGRLEQMVDRVKLDLWYVNHWSLGLDHQYPAADLFRGTAQSRVLTRPRGGALARPAYIQFDRVATIAKACGSVRSTPSRR